MLNPQEEAERLTRLKDHFGSLVAGLAKSAAEKGLLLNLAQRRNPKTGELETHVAVTANSMLSGDPSDEDVPLEMDVQCERDSGVVTVTFNQPIALLTMDGDQAIALAQMLVNHAKVAGTTKQVDFIL